jgi:AcrR family transcriptional regulator
MADKDLLRADALANRGRILDAADDVFSRGGEAASTEEVARVAGVGIATVFRHFPTKAALLEAVLVRRFERQRDRASKLEQHDDPGAAFFELFAQIVSDASGKIAIAEAVVAAGGEHARARHASEQLRQSIGVLLRRAQDAKAVRADVALDEVYALLVATSRGAASMQLHADVRARLLAVLFDGLRAPRH